MNINLIRSAEYSEIENFFIKGMEFFRQDKLKESIEVWTRILLWKPDYVEAQKAIKKARELIVKLENAKKNKQLSYPPTWFI